MATASDPRQHVHELVDQLNEQQLPQAAHALEAIQDASLEAILRAIPSLQMPDHWPPQFVEFEPLPVTGEDLPSERLIRERR
jgi:hypothetical protein